MKYRNKKTGGVIEIGSRLNGADWEAVETQPPAKPTRKPQKVETQPPAKPPRKPQKKVKAK